MNGAVATSAHTPSAASVVLENDLTHRRFETHTDKEGNFEFHSLAPGGYSITISSEAAPAIHQHVVLDDSSLPGISISATIPAPAAEGTSPRSPDLFRVKPIKPRGLNPGRGRLGGLKPQLEAQTDVAGGGTNSAADFNIYSYVLNQNPPNFGFNLSDGGGANENEWLTNGGEEPYDSRISITATATGTDTTLIAGASRWGATDIFSSIITGFYVGATAYTYRYSNNTWSLLRQDTVTGYTAVPGSTDPADHTITFANSGPVSQPGDVIWLDLDGVVGVPRGNDYYDRGPDPNNPTGGPQFPTLCLDWNTESSGCWKLYNNLPAPYSIVSDVPVPTGDQIAAGAGYVDQTSLEVQNSNSVVDGIQRFLGPSYECTDPNSTNFPPGDTFELGVWLKGQTSDGVVTARFGQLNIGTTFTGINSTWQYFTWDFPAPACLANGSPYPDFHLDYNAPGTLEVNGVHLFDKQYTPFAVLPQIVQAWQDYKPATLRLWSNYSDTSGRYQFWSLDSWLAPEWQKRTSPIIGNYLTTDVDAQHLPAGLALAKQIGANPWLIVNMSITQQEWGELIDYLAAPAGVGYASKRPTDHPGPYTSDFSTIYVEIGNEEWGTNLVPIDDHYGAWAQYAVGTALQAKTYDTSALQFVLNGFFEQASFGSSASAAAPFASRVDFANYTGPDVGLKLTGDAFYQADLLQLPSFNKGNIDALVNQQQIDANAGHSYQLAIYETGPGTDTPASVGDPSLAAGVSALDAALYAASQGVREQNYFLWALGDGPYSAFSTFANGFNPHPAWEAFQMRNKYLAGDVVLTKANADPVTSDGNSYPLIAVYAFRESNDQADVVVISRDLNNTTPVTLHLPAAPTGSATLYTLTGDPRSDNDTSLVDPIASQSISNFTQDYTFNMPPGSIYLFQVPTTGGWSSAVPVPPAPGNVVATPDNGKVGLSWTRAVAASGYTIFRGTQSGGPYTQIATATSDLKYTDSSVSNGTTYYYVVTATNSAGSSGNSAEVSATPSVVEFGFTSIAPPVDGSAGGAWANAPAIALGHDINGTTSDQALYQALWDNTNLYILATVTDNTPITSTNVFNGDSVEVYFSGTDSKAQSYGPTDFQFAFPYGGTTVTESKHNATAGIVFGQQPIAGGYRIGISIPWSTLGTTPGAGTQYGFDVMVNDASAVDVRAGKIAWWATQDLSYQYPYLFGPAVLASGSTEITGTPVAVPNPSFELDTVQSGSNFYSAPQGWSFSSSGSSANNFSIPQLLSTATTPVLGVDGVNFWDPADFNPSTPPIGSSTATLTTSQSVGTFAANTVYTLTVALADPADSTTSSFKQLGFQLLANGSPAAIFSTNSVGLNSAFQDFTLNFDTAAHSSVVGQTITIALVYTYTGDYNRSAYFDNVRLVTNPSGAGGNPTATPTSTQLSITPSGTLIAGQSLTLTATVSANSGSTAPTGSVSFAIGGSSQSAALNSSGVATLTTTAPAAGTYSVTASYTATGNFANSASAEGSITVVAAPSYFPSGFSSSAGLTLNGSAIVTNGVLQLTDTNGCCEAGSAFYVTPIGLNAAFTTDFDFQLLNANADGFTFTIQNQGLTALGGNGSSLGYEGINNSVTMKFDLYGNASQGSIGLFTNGAEPENPDTPLANGVNLHNGDRLHAHIAYDGSSTLTVTVSDNSNSAETFTASFPVNLSTTIGASTAYVGFTGATGGFTAQQDILNWTLTQ